MLDMLGYSLSDVENKNISDIDSKVEAIGIKELSDKLQVGEVTLKDIIAEIISEDAKLRKYIRDLAFKEGKIITKNTKDEISVYDMYYDYSEPVKTLAPHRILAINRGEKEEFLKVKIEKPEEKILDYLKKQIINMPKLLKRIYYNWSLLYI